MGCELREKLIVFRTLFFCETIASVKSFAHAKRRKVLHLLSSIGKAPALYVILIVLKPVQQKHRFPVHLA